MIYKYFTYSGLLLLVVNFTFFKVAGQEIGPTETKALMDITVTDFSGKPLANEVLSFVGTKVKKEVSCKTGKDGKTKLLLPEGDTYEVKYRDLIEEVNYSKVEIPSEIGAFTYQLTIKYEPEKVFTLKNVHFETGKATITVNSFPALNELVVAMKSSSTMVIEIAGHTDNVGSAETNQKLSEDRANSVRQYLISKGIAAPRVSAMGYGNSQPVADNSTEDGRQKNRRTEVRIIKE
jgi:outer membrane protein OmpA-like peptidoglycan-associated protein